MKKDKKKYYSKEIKREKQVSEDYKRFVTFIVVLLITVGLFAVLFLFNGMFVTKDYFQKETTTTTTEPSYDPTLLTVSNLFKVKDNDYYVMFYDTKEETTAFLYNGLVVSYNGEVPVYSIDLNSAMNKKYYDKKGEANKTPTKASEVLVTGPTLMHIKKGKVTEFITDRDEIVKILAPRPETEEK